MELINGIISIPILSSNKKEQYILLIKATCGCKGYKFRNTCKHIKQVENALEKEFINVERKNPHA